MLAVAASRSALSLQKVVLLPFVLELLLEDEELLLQAPTMPTTARASENAAMRGGAGADAIELLQRGAPDALLVAFCSDADLTRMVAALGVVTVEKVGIMHLDELIAVVQEKLGRTATRQPEDIPVTDMDTPV